SGGRFSLLFHFTAGGERRNWPRLKAFVFQGIRQRYAGFLRSKRALRNCPSPCHTLTPPERRMPMFKKFLAAAVLAVPLMGALPASEAKAADMPSAVTQQVAQSVNRANQGYHRHHDHYRYRHYRYHHAHGVFFYRNIWCR